MSLKSTDTLRAPFPMQTAEHLVAMQISIDPYDAATAYADLREDEPITEALRERARGRASQLGAEHVEFWRPPYGAGTNRMAGFVELVGLNHARASHGE